MYVCVCGGVTDREVARLVREGCADLAAVAERSGATGYCGICREDVQRVVDETRGSLVAAGKEPDRAG